MRAWAWFGIAWALLAVGCTHDHLGEVGSSGSSGSTGFDAGPPPMPYSRSTQPNPIAAENQKTGDGTWYIQQESNNREIEGYASDVSAEAGETLDISVSTSIASSYTYSLYRLGDYGGQGARRILTGPTLQGQPGAPCIPDPVTMRVECSWPTSFSLAIPADWVSGVYVIKLHRADGFERYVSFIVRDHRTAEILFKAAVDTDEAYNRWGGESLYYDSSGTMPASMGYQVSFDRPFDDGAGMYGMLWWEQHAVRFLERNGYDVSYGTNVDAYRFDGFYDGIGAIVTAGHDEYWTQRERDVIDSVVAGGQTSLVNLTANASYWRVRYDPDAQGRPYRRMSCYKSEQQHDPLAATLGTTARFRDPPDAQPENGLFGAMYEDWALMGFPLRIGEVSHPLFSGTGFQSGDLVPALVGYEYDTTFANGLTPAGTTVLATSPMLNAEQFASAGQLVVRTTPQGREVFSAGSIYWPLALSTLPSYQDTRIWKLTWNALEAALSHRHTPRPPPAYPQVTLADPPPNPHWASVIAAVAGVPGVHQVLNGPAASAGFSEPTGIAADGLGNLFVAESTAEVIREISNGQVSTYAGDGTDGDLDGPAAQARFRHPTALAVGPDGALYVADSDNHLIRRIDPSGAHAVSTYAGIDNRLGGYQDGPGAQAYFNRPVGLVFGLRGELYVADEENNLIRMIGTDAAHTVSTFAGTWNGFADGPALSAAFNYPTGVTMGPDGTLYILDSGNGLIRRIKPSSNPTVDTIVGQRGFFGCVDGTGDQALIRGQLGFLWMPSGVLWADASSNKIRQVVPGATAAASTVTTFAGSGGFGTALSTPALSDLDIPAGLAVGRDGKVYVTDSANGVIRVLTP